MLAGVAFVIVAAVLLSESQSEASFPLQCAFSVTVFFQLVTVLSRTSSEHEQLQWAAVLSFRPFLPLPCAGWSPLGQLASALLIPLCALAAGTAVAGGCAAWRRRHRSLATDIERGPGLKSVLRLWLLVLVPLTAAATRLVACVSDGIGSELYLVAAPTALCFQTPAHIALAAAAWLVLAVHAALFVVVVRFGLPPQSKDWLSFRTPPLLAVASGLTRHLRENARWFAGAELGTLLLLVAVCAALPPSESLRSFAAVSVAALLAALASLVRPHASQLSTVSLLLRLLGVAVVVAGESPLASDLARVMQLLFCVLVPLADCVLIALRERWSARADDDGVLLLDISPSSDAVGDGDGDGGEYAALKG